MKHAHKTRKHKALASKKRATAVHIMPAPPENRPGTYSRDLKLRASRRRARREQAQINVCFASREDYELIISAASVAGESRNLFITTAALNRAKQLDSPGVSEPVAETVS